MRSCTSGESARNDYIADLPQILQPFLCRSMCHSASRARQRTKDTHKNSLEAQTTTKFIYLPIAQLCFASGPRLIALKGSWCQVMPSTVSSGIAPGVRRVKLCRVLCTDCRGQVGGDAEGGPLYDFASSPSMGISPPASSRPSTERSKGSSPSQPEAAIRRHSAEQTSLI